MTAGVTMGLVTGPVLGGLALLAVLLAYLLVAFWVGLRLMPLLPAGVHALCTPERVRLRVLLGADTPQPLTPGRPGVVAVASDPQTWRESAWLASQILLGPLAFALVVALWGAPLFLLTLPTWAYAVSRVPLGPVTVSSERDALLAAVVGLLLLPVAASLVRLFGAALARTAEGVLGADVHARLAAATARAEELERTRAVAVSAALAERHRLERDLHDGAQSRLVSLAVTLALAEEAFERDPAGSRALLQEARAGAAEAVQELRTLSRGLAPAVLRARGLPAGLDALAAAAQPLPVTVDSSAYTRAAPEAVESALYFAAAEALTNSSKHAGAARAEVSLAGNDDGWSLVVRDDGRGGARPVAHGGLAGLRDRLAPFDAVLQVHSPPGGGTTVHVTVPLPP